MAKVSKQEYAEQLQRLRKWLPPGSTLYTVLEHVSRSGMQRTIRTLIPYTREQCDRCSAPAYPDREDGDSYTRPEDWRSRIGEPCTGGDRSLSKGCIGKIEAKIDHVHPNHAVSIVTGYTRDNGREGVKIGGCGMDMGFALVDHVSSKLWGGKRCDCGNWYLRRAAQHGIPALGEWEYQHAEEWQSYLQGAKQFGSNGRPTDEPEGTEYIYRYIANCDKCKGSGNVIGTGYQCLGKGKCPSNYHVNHRDRVRCKGTRVHNPHGPDTGTFCYKPGGLFSRHEIPEGWPMLKIKIGKGKTVDLQAACITDENGEHPEICPTCKGKGDLPNPDGPERFDLEHFDGYAIRHRWL